MYSNSLTSPGGISGINHMDSREQTRDDRDQEAGQVKDPEQL